MGDFDWSGTISAAIKDLPEALQCVVVAGTSHDGVAAGSFPLSGGGEYQFWVYSDPYKAPIAKDDGSEVEEDVTETWNLACVCTGAKDDALLKSQGLRLNQAKYTILRTLEGATAVTAVAKLEDGATHNVTFEKVFVCKSKECGLVLGVKGGYYFAAKYKADPRADPSLAVIDRLAIAFYWATGADA